MGSVHIMRRSGCSFAALVVVAQAACLEPGEPNEATLVRDSAGVRIVENRTPASSAPWRVALEPNVLIGGDETDSTQLLFRVAGAVGLSDGGTVIAHGPAPMLRWYDASGAYRFGAGRPGGGPGEFGGGEGAWIATIWPLPGDSVATWEHALRRMQVFSPDGRFFRAVVLELPPTTRAAAYPQIVGPLKDGFVAFLNTQRELGPIGEVVREPLMYIRYRGDGSYAGEIAKLPGFTSFTRKVQTPDGREAKASGRPPFAKLPSAWPTESGLYYGSGDRYEIAFYDSVGVLHMLIRRPKPEEPVTAELIEREKSQLMAGAPNDPGVRRQWESALNSAPYPESFPAYRRIRVDRPGMLWVQDYNLPGADSVTWSVFDQEGRWLSEVAIPEPWQVLDIGADYMLVLVRGELDVERVERHALSRG